jgi:hypothetical protein
MTSSTRDTLLEAAFGSWPLPEALEGMADALLAAGLASLPGWRLAPPPYNPNRDGDTLLLNPVGIADGFQLPLIRSTTFATPSIVSRA